MLRQPRPYAASALARGSLLTLITLIALLLTLGMALARPSGLVQAAPPVVTVQDGEWNYAGPASSCPGPHWNCVGSDAFPVAQTGTENVIVASDQVGCVGSTQSGASNTFSCTLDDSPQPQTCEIDQLEGGHNVAICKLTHVNTSGDIQCAVQRADIHQAGITNQLKADFRIVQQLTSGSSQTQGASQILIATQDADEKNQSEVEQVQIQEASGDATVQRQNAGDCALPPSEPPIPLDCAPEDPGFGPDTPNTCVHLIQRIPPAGDSENISKLKQEVKQQAVTTADGAVQTQGTPTSGNDAHIDQSAPPTIDQSAPPTGKNVDVADQYTEQKLVAPDNLLDAPTQSQFEDPGCCGRSQDGGEDNEETINQWVYQEAGPDAEQVASAKGYAESQSPSMTDECTITQNLQNNGGTADVSEKQEPCDVLFVGTMCSSGGISLLLVTGTCTTTTEPPDVD